MSVVPAPCVGLCTPGLGKPLPQAGFKTPSSVATRARHAANARRLACSFETALLLSNPSF